VKNAVPIIVGLTITALIGVFAPLTSAGINPARDLGPRLVAYAAGWGAPVFQSAWAYTVGPLIGAPLGVLLYKSLY